MQPWISLAVTRTEEDSPMPQTMGDSDSDAAPTEADWQDYVECDCPHWDYLPLTDDDCRHWGRWCLDERPCELQIPTNERSA